MKQEYYFGIAKAVAEGSKCLRRQYGAVIVKHDTVISTGTNGAPRGEIDCKHTNFCQRQADSSAHGSDYSNCKSVHAEMNAIINASPEDMRGATLYLVGLEHGIPVKSEPCYICKKLIKQAGITSVQHY